MGTRKSYSAGFKTKVAFEAIKNHRTINEIASDYEVHPNQVTQWKKRVIEEAGQVFGHKRERQQRDGQQLTDELYRQIGQLKVELDWLKKKLGHQGS